MTEAASGTGSDCGVGGELRPTRPDYRPGTAAGSGSWQIRNDGPAPPRPVGPGPGLEAARGAAGFATIRESPGARATPPLAGPVCSVLARSRSKAGATPDAKAAARLLWMLRPAGPGDPVRRCPADAGHATRALLRSTAMRASPRERRRDRC